MPGYTSLGIEVTPQQAHVIQHVVNSPVTVVAAGAGSGKTHTTVASVLELIHLQLATLDQFVLITFTKKAADELRDRLEKEIMKVISNTQDATMYRFWMGQLERLSAAYVGTIHSFCRRILQTFGYEERVPREIDLTFSRTLLNAAADDAVEQYILFSREQRSQDPLLLREPLIWREDELATMAKDILDTIHNQGTSAETVVSDTLAQPHAGGWPYRRNMAELVRRVERNYSQRKMEAQVLDPHDLLRLTDRLLSGQGGGLVVSRLAQRFHYLFIDEFQDTDSTQKSIIDTLKSEIQLLVVGDRKQSIYAFRAGNPSLLSELAAESNTQILLLNVSRRPTEPLLNIQNALFAAIAQNNVDSGMYSELEDPLEPWEGTIQPQSNLIPLQYLGAGDPGRTGVLPRITATANLIRRLLREQLDDPNSPGGLRNIRPRDIVILGRTNDLLETYELQLGQLLSDDGIVVRSDKGGGLFKQPEIASVYHMLRLLLYYPDDVALSLALSTPYMRNVDARAREQELVQYGHNRGQPLTDWFEAYYTQHRDRLNELRGEVRTATVPELLLRLYEMFGIRDFYRSRADGQAEANLEKLRSWAREIYSSSVEALTLRRFVQLLEVAIRTAHEESEAFVEDVDDSQQFVRLLTIHRAKGLEFPIVIIPEVQIPLITPQRVPKFLIVPEWGLELDLSTHVNDAARANGFATQSDRLAQELALDQNARLEEELRLFYVAVTRARQAVRLIGSSITGATPKRPGEQYYSWKDEVFRARPAILSLGAQFVQA